MSGDYREVLGEVFKAFLNDYPRPLEHNCCGFVEPPQHCYYDWSLTRAEPGTHEYLMESKVAYCYEDWRWHYFLHNTVIPAERCLPKRS